MMRPDHEKSVEELEREIAEVAAAIVQGDEVIRTLYDRSEGSLGENLAVLALELNDATEDLNDALRGAEAAMQGWPSVSLCLETDELGWDGAHLLWNGKPLLSASRRCRMEGARRLFELFELVDPLLAAFGAQQPSKGTAR